LIYAVEIHQRTPLVTDVQIAKRYQTTAFTGIAYKDVNRGGAVSMGTPASSWDAVTEPGEIWLGTSEVAGTIASGGILRVAATPEMSDTELTIAIAKANATPDFSASLEELNVKDYVTGDFLYIKSKSGQEIGDTIYYKLRFVVKNDALTISNAKISDISVGIGEVGLGSFPGDENYSFIMGDAGYLFGAKLATDATGGYAHILDASANVVVAVDHEPTLKVEYGHTVERYDYAVEFGTSNNLGKQGAVGEWIALQVTNELGEKAWYRFRIISEAANTTLTDIKVGGVSATSLGTAGISDAAAYGQFTGVPGTVTLTTAQAGDGSTVKVVATGPTGATYRYDWGANFYGANYPGGAWKSTGDGLFVGGSLFGGGATVEPGVNGSLIFVEVTAKDGVTVAVYALNCVVSN
jgi:hypothetical protein